MALSKELWNHLCLQVTLDFSELQSGATKRQQYPGLEDAKPEHLGLDRPQVTSCYLHTCPKQKEASK